MVTRLIAVIACTLTLMTGFSLQPVIGGDFAYFFKHFKPTGNCPIGMQEIPASFYLSGKRTANGERFNPHGHTAASRTLPFNTRLRLYNPRTGKSVVVRINDRGPYKQAHRLGVKLDLALGAARSLGMVQTEWICMGNY